MKYLRTNLATDWPEDMGDKPGCLERILGFILSDPSPDYKGKRHLVHEWLIEFDESGYSGREIGLDMTGRPVLAGPDDRNYGFWLDTNMKLKDFSGEPIEVEEFERLWKESGVIEPS